MASYGLASVKKLQSKLATAQVRSRKLRVKAAETVQTVIRTGEVGGTAFAFGALTGRQGAVPSIAGVPADLGVAVAMHGMALLGVGGQESHFKAIGDGALASYLYGVGAGVGSDMRARAGGAPITSGYLDEGEEEMSGGYGLTEEELELAGL